MNQIRKSKTNLTAIVIFFILTINSLFGQSAAELYEKGDFEEAERIYQDVIKNDPQNYLATLKLGSIALLGNRFEEAETILKKAIELKPDEPKPKSLLAETFYRQDKFIEAAPLFRAAGNEEKAKHLEDFKNKIPYRFESDLNQTEISFEITDPLPVLKLIINGHEAEFILDTGGDELHLDPEFAEDVGAEMFGESTRNFAGGMKATIKYGAIDQVEIGGFRIKNVPVNSVPMGMIAQAFGRPIKDVVGTVFLYHFLATIDYLEGKLVLQKKTQENTNYSKNEYDVNESFEMSFWLASDHVMVAKGRVNDSPEYMFYLDTGLAGAGGVMVSPEFSVEAKIELPNEEAQGIGGSGKTINIKPIVAEEVWLGKAVEKNVRGLYGGLHTNDEYRASAGFRIVGIISHDFFRSYRVTFDFTSMRLFLKRDNH